MNATLREPLYLIPKDNQLFFYTKFPVKKIDVGKTYIMIKIVA
jgi:hypothetical protein